jgi:RNA recognition motif-containing protein
LIKKRKSIFSNSIKKYLELYIFNPSFYFSDATIYVGGLDEKVNESLLWELFVQGGPVVNVHMPKDRVTMMHQGKQLCNIDICFCSDFSIVFFNYTIRMSKIDCSEN